MIPQIFRQDDRITGLQDQAGLEVKPPPSYFLNLAILKS
jgi:hypothetical protein